MAITGKTYEARYLSQLAEWRKGNSLHNKVDGQCCPDFSCCNKTMNTPLNKRDQFCRLYETQGEDGIIPMLGEFLGEAIQKAGQKKVKVITGKEQSN